MAMISLQEEIASNEYLLINDPLSERKLINPSTSEDGNNMRGCGRNVTKMVYDLDLGTIPEAGYTLKN